MDYIEYKKNRNVLLSTDYKSALADPSLGRFLSPDPLLSNVKLPAAHNSYAYCMNNPVLFRLVHMQYLEL